MLRYIWKGCAAFAVLAASPAAADITAVYKGSQMPMTMTVEIADDGRVRYQTSGNSTYGLVIDDVDYMIQAGTTGPIVERAADLMTVQKEMMAQFMPRMSAQQKHAAMEFVESGRTTINGRDGIGFRSKGSAAKDNLPPDVVISEDPKLKPLGKVMAHQFSKSMAMMGDILGDGASPFASMEAVLKRGAPLRFATMELQTVNEAPIDPRRFSLPAPPQTIDQIRARLKPLPLPPTAIPPKE